MAFCGCRVVYNSIRLFSKLREWVSSWPSVRFCLRWAVTYRNEREWTAKRVESTRGLINAWWTLERRAGIIKDLSEGGWDEKVKPCFSSCETSHALGAFERLSRKTRTRHRRRVDVVIQSQSETSAFVNLQRQHALNFCSRDCREDNNILPWKSPATPNERTRLFTIFSMIHQGLRKMISFYFFFFSVFFWLPRRVCSADAKYREST